MNLVSLEIPDDTAELAAWLEKHILGADLGKLVAELSAVSSPISENSLDNLFGSSLPQILEHGLGEVPRETLRSLVQQPQLLFDLQERVFIEGGAYWSQQPSGESPLDALAQTHWDAIASNLDPADRPTSRMAGPAATTHRVPWFRQPVVVSFATAAAVLVGVMIWQDARPVAPPPTTAWGWNRDDALAADASAADYLNRLADSANDWFNKRPETSQALATRIIQFRQGCSKLILSDHKPLAKEDRDWLVERCQVWAGKLDQHLAAVEAGRDVVDVRGEADETINKLISAIRDRAKQLS